MIKEKIEKLLQNVVPSGIKILVESSRDEKFGDYSTNIAFLLAKKDLSADRQEKKSPQEIAKDLIKKIPKNDFLDKIEKAPNGFINFWISKKWLKQQLKIILEQKDKFGTSEAGKGKKIQVEFISANPTGPLTLGNGRGGFFGDVLANVLQKTGHIVDREYFINDSGNQILALGHSILKERGLRIEDRGKDKKLYKGKYINEVAKKVGNQTDPGKVGQTAAKIILDDFIKKDVSKMKIKFDKWISEDQLKKSGKVKKIIEELDKKGLVYKKDSASWLKTTKYGDDQDRVIIRKDGQTTYFPTDIAYHLDKFERGYDKVIDVWGADHAGHLKRMMAVGKIFNYDDKLKIIINQLVRLVKSKKHVKMSKREGKAIYISDLIDDVGLDSVRYFFLTRTPDTHLDFDLSIAREQSKKNPVFYIQYAGARIHSILAKIKSQKSNLKNTNQNLNLLTKKEELNLIKHLIKYPDLVKEISQNHSVHLLTSYLLELADKFHNFYEKHKVITDDKKLTASRLELIKAVNIVLKNCLDLLGISSPKKM